MNTRGHEVPQASRLTPAEIIADRIERARAAVRKGENGRLHVYVAAAVSQAEGLSLECPFDAVTEPGLGDAWQWFVWRVLRGVRDVPAVQEPRSPAYAELVGGGA